MESLAFVLIALALLIGFVALVEYEVRHDVRVAPRLRTRLDEQVLRAEFLITHVDLAAFIKSEFEAGMHRLGHDTVHLTLRLVRAAERLLTRVVRRLRLRVVEEEAPRETTREFVRTLSEFKDTLDATHPEIQESPAAESANGSETPPPSRIG